VGTNAEIAVLNSSGKLVMESIIETKANTILEFVHGLRGSLYLTFEEGTWGRRQGLRMKYRAKFAVGST
jgi:hypothetical protein